MLSIQAYFSYEAGMLSIQAYFSYEAGMLSIQAYTLVVRLVMGSNILGYKLSDKLNVNMSPF